MTRRDLLMQEFSEVADALLGLPEDIRYVNSNRESLPEQGIQTLTTLYVEADGKLLALTYTRLWHGFSFVTTEEIDER